MYVIYIYKYIFDLALCDLQYMAVSDLPHHRCNWLSKIPLKTVTVRNTNFPAKILRPRRADKCENRLHKEARHKTKDNKGETRTQNRERQRRDRDDKGETRTQKQGPQRRDKDTKPRTTKATRTGRQTKDNKGDESKPRTTKAGEGHKTKDDKGEISPRRQFLFFSRFFWFLVQIFGFSMFFCFFPLHFVSRFVVFNSKLF